jgi:predicted hydrocarbon binding protein
VLPSAAVKARAERLGRKARVRADILIAHLNWASKRWPSVSEALRPHLDAATFALVEKPPRGGETAMVLFSDLVRIDRALAAAAGGDPEPIFHALGAQSAQQSLAGLYDCYRPEDVHGFFQSISVIHRAFQDFGKSTYERLGERSGRVQIARYREFSPVFCTSGAGYYEEALRLMKAPGPIQVRETACHCSGDGACVFEMNW